MEYIVGMKRSNAFALLALLLVSSAHGATLAKQLAARSLSAAGLPDPHCKSGILSLKVDGQPQSCCAGYCGACNDYETCKSVRGQASENACCASKVYEMRCGNAPANVCLKKCSESVPPCIMDTEVPETAPKIKKVNGVPDCNEVVPHARGMHTNAVDKGQMLSDIHFHSTLFEEAVHYATAAKAQLKADAADPQFPKEYKAKLDAQSKQVDKVIGFVQKHESKNKELEDKVSAIKSGLAIPRQLQLEFDEMTQLARKDDKEGYDSKDKSGSLHYEAYMSLAKAALKEASAKEAAAKKAAEVAAAKKKSSGGSKGSS